jgi:hypothetical protein
MRTRSLASACRRRGVVLVAAGPGERMPGAGSRPRFVLVCLRTLYDYQDFNSAGPYGDNGWLEDYTAGVPGEPIGNVTLVTRNAAGLGQHIVGNYRPPEHTAALVPADRREARRPAQRGFDPGGSGGAASGCLFAPM